MALSEGDKAIVREIAFEAAAVIKTEIVSAVKAELRLHQAECPIGQTVNEKINQAKGARWAFWLMVAGITAIVNLLFHFWRGRP